MGFFYGYPVKWLVRLIVVATLVLITAIKWIKEYKKNQTDYDNELERQLEILKYKNSQNKQKGKKNDNQS